MLDLSTVLACTASVWLCASCSLPDPMQAKQALCGSTLHCRPAQCCNDAGAKNTSEHFNTAGRSVKTGLIAVDVVSHWTWSVSVSSLAMCLHLCLMAADWQHAPHEPLTLQQACCTAYDSCDHYECAPSQR